MNEQTWAVRHTSILLQDVSAEPLLSSVDHNVQVHSDAALSVVAFNTEASWDTLSINTEAGFEKLLIISDSYSG